jgi:hypothetical protein
MVPAYIFQWGVSWPTGKKAILLACPLFPYILPPAPWTLYKDWSKEDAKVPVPVPKLPPTKSFVSIPAENNPAIENIQKGYE